MTWTNLQIPTSFSSGACMSWSCKHSTVFHPKCSFLELSICFYLSSSCDQGEQIHHCSFYKLFFNGRLLYPPPSVFCFPKIKQTQLFQPFLAVHYFETSFHACFFPLNSFLLICIFPEVRPALGHSHPGKPYISWNNLLVPSSMKDPPSFWNETYSVLFIVS